MLQPSTTREQVVGSRGLKHELSTDLSKTAKKVVEIYSHRMQIEEGFRDLKSTKYGFGFEHVNTWHIYRLNVFFLIAMLAAFLAWVIDWLAEKVNLQAQYQANSTKTKRIFSLFYPIFRSNF
jgi:transposase